MTMWCRAFLPRVLIIALLAAVFSLTPTGSDASGRVRILFVNPGYADKGFWHEAVATMKAAADHFGYDLTVVSGDRKWPLMVSRGLQAIENDTYDLAILVNEHQQAPVLMEAVQSRGLPMLLLLNNLTPEQQVIFGGPREKISGWIGSITPDNGIAGYEMAQSLLTEAKRLGIHGDKNGRLRLLSLAGDFKTPASIDRLGGLDHALAKFRNLHEVRRLTVNWSEDEAYRRTKILLGEQDIDAIWAANDQIAFGAIRAMKEAGRTPGKDFVIAGLNWSKKAVDLVRAGKMTMTHGGHFFAGAWAIVMIHDYLSGKDFADLSTHIRFPMSAIDRNNADAYAAIFGDRNWSKIDFSRFSRADTPGLKAYPFNLTALLHSVK